MCKCNRLEEDLVGLGINDRLVDEPVVRRRIASLAYVSCGSCA